LEEGENIQELKHLVYPHLTLHERAGCALCNWCEASWTMYRIGFGLAIGEPLRKLRPVKG
jgi:hypothetical protein